MKSSFFFTALCFLIPVCSVYAQHNEGAAPAKISFESGGGAGVFIPFDKNRDDKTQIGSVTATTFQLNYLDRYFAKIQFSQTTVNFSTSANFGAIGSEISAKSNITNLGLNLGYQRSFGKWQPYFLAGAGAAFIDIPVTSFDEKKNSINFSTTPSTQLYISAGAGINYKISNSLIIFWETQASTLPAKPINSSTHLSGLTEILGIKANL